MKAVHFIGSLDAQQDPIFGSLIHNTRIQWWGHSVACVASVSVWFRSKERPKNDDEWDFRVWPHQKWALTNVPHSLLRNRTETEAETLTKQATIVGVPRSVYNVFFVNGGESNRAVELLTSGHRNDSRIHLTNVVAGPRITKTYILAGWECLRTYCELSKLNYYCCCFGFI